MSRVPFSSQLALGLMSAISCVKIWICPVLLSKHSPGPNIHVEELVIDGPPLSDL